MGKGGRHRTVVKVLEMAPTGTDREETAPDALSLIETPRVRRQVWLENEAGERLGYAVSWWNEADVATHLPDQRVPIGRTLASKRTETFREIHGASLSVPFEHFMVTS